jgi:manganese/zinc/iron transport system permease protein
MPFPELLGSYNTRVVLLGVCLLGMAAGLVGVYMLLRRRSLMADATSHATLPGIALAFLIQPHFGFEPKFLPGLLLGALATGLLGMACIQAIQRVGRIHEDAAMGIVLSVFYGFGICLLGIIQKMQQGAAAGLGGFVFGKTASMLAADAQLIAVAAAAIAALVLLLHKEFGLLCFDAEFAGSQGWPRGLLDALLMGSVVAVTVIGLQAVGLILMIALLVIPPASARFWTDRMVPLLLLSSAFGGAGALLGVLVSARAADAPAGAVIVLCQGLFFVVSLFFGNRRGLCRTCLRELRLRSGIRRQHILRLLYEGCERKGLPENSPEARLPFAELLAARSWPPRRLRRMLWRMKWEGWVYRHPDGRWGLTREGWPLAARMVRNHRLWEIFLIHYADIAPGQVDRGADRIEHVLSPRILQDLERLLREAGNDVPSSPHQIGAPI